MILSNIETQIVSYLVNSTDDVNLEELSKFSKAGVKIKTVQKNYSDLVLKFKRENKSVPWTCKVIYPTFQKNKIITKSNESESQRLVQIKYVKEQNAAQIDFKLDRNSRSVITKEYGKIQIQNHDDWDILKFILENAGRRIFLHELKDVVYHNAGSKTPARWFNIIQRRINDLRRIIPTLKNRLITVPNNDIGTFYLMQ